MFETKNTHPFPPGGGGAKNITVPVVCSSLEVRERERERERGRDCVCVCVSLCIYTVLVHPAQ